MKGWRDENDNPVRDVKLKRIEVNRARLTWELFCQIHASSDSVWFRNAMELALVRGLARAEIVAAQFNDVHDGH